MADKVLVLEFEEWPGFEARLRLAPVSVNELFSVTDIFDTANLGDRAGITALFEAFAPFLLGWKPHRFRADAAGLAKIDANLAIAIVAGWVREVRNAPLPLPRKSSGGAPSEGQTTSP